MLSAIVLLNTERDKTNKVAQELADLDGVTEVYSVAGRYDLAGIVRASDNDQLAPRFGADVLHWDGESLGRCYSIVQPFKCFTTSSRAQVPHSKTFQQKIE